MPTATVKRTRSVAEAILEIIRRRPGISVRELAAELHVDTDVLLNLARAEIEKGAVADGDRDDDVLRGSEATVDLSAAAWGPVPTASELAAARATGEASVREALDIALRGALTREQAAERIGVTTPQAVSERLRRGRLTALRRGREWRFPAWQFADDGTLPGLPDLIAVWPGTPLSLSIWAVKPNPDLHGHTPAQELARGEGRRRVVELVKAIEAAGW